MSENNKTKQPVQANEVVVIAAVRELLEVMDIETLSRREKALTDYGNDLAKNLQIASMDLQTVRALLKVAIAINALAPENE